MDIQVKAFNKLTLSELYDLLKLRSEVFVVEQECIYQDIDNKDRKALHLLGIKNDKIVAYTRIFAPGHYFEYASIGRVVVEKSERKYGYGHDIMKASIEVVYNNFGPTIIKISAQEYLQKFYENHQFVFTGKKYLEDGIPHIEMIKSV
ncbi:GNAT family N-acetyltransferase [Abyssalbus ytuae]|uniref:GNAT family N-acetyltransferase n=1 Tax=Abyssalbus ytuae TaxID=2926907 RepID=A0A9E7CV30_9FLAO|nr:GNAT family N-acetyltransferase [Abyssalbus ytuae]UOB19317.1 GNAT family N-acetyltransferase [Abyssalbus ytuae]